MALVPAQLVNGTNTTSLHDGARRLATFHEKLSRLQDDVFAGRHPRIKLSDGVIAQVTKKSSVGQAQTQNAAPTPATAEVRVTAPRPVQPSLTALQPSAMPDKTKRLPHPPAAALPFSSSTSAAIDPILLTKSDDLVRAELHMKRKRIETALANHVGPKPSQSRDSGADVASQGALDVSEILRKALELVKPVSGIAKPPEPASASAESFDENSYYSSKATSWSTEEGEVADGEGQEGASSQAAQGVESSTGSGQASASGTQQPQLTVDTQTAQAAVQRSPSAADASADESDFYDDPPTATLEREESEYSPPAPEDIGPPEEEHDLPGLGGPIIAPLSAPQVSYNNIQTPVAPQPSRVSPLATAKPPRLGVRDNNGAQRAVPPSPRGASGPAGHHSQQLSGYSVHSSPRRARRQSPATAPLRAGLRNPRKRRREAEGSGTAPERQPAGKRPAREAEIEAEIKEEPVSPPPFTLIPDTRYSYERRPVAHEDIEIISPPRYRPVSVHYRDAAPADRAPAPYAYPIDEPPSPTYIRVPSRSARADPDLRRVASLQFAGRPRSPSGSQTASYVAVDGRTLRAASHAYADRAVLSAPLHHYSHRSESARPLLPPSGSRSPPYLADFRYSSTRPPSPGAMRPPPPPRQIVVDRHGNRYYAAPPPPPPPRPHSPPSSVLFSMHRPDADPPPAPHAHRPLYARAHPGPYDDPDAPPPRMPPPPPRRPADADRADPYRPLAHAYHPDLELLDPAPPPRYAPRASSARPRPAAAAVPARYERVPGSPAASSSSGAAAAAVRSYSARPEAAPMYVEGRQGSARPAGGEYAAPVAGGGYVRREEGLGGGVYREVSVRRDGGAGGRYAYGGVGVGAVPGGGWRRVVEADEDEGVWASGGEGRVAYRY